MYKDSDYDEIVKLYKFYETEFELPRIEEGLINVVVEHSDNITGFGQLRTMLEITMMLGSSGKFTKAQDIIDMLGEAKVVARLENKNSLYCFVKNQDFATLLKRHDFRNTNGEGLVVSV